MSFDESEDRFLSKLHPDLHHWDLEPWVALCFRPERDMLTLLEYDGKSDQPTQVCPTVALLPREADDYHRNLIESYLDHADRRRQLGGYPHVGGRGVTFCEGLVRLVWWSPTFESRSGHEITRLLLRPGEVDTARFRGWASHKHAASEALLSVMGLLSPIYREWET